MADFHLIFDNKGVYKGVCGWQDDDNHGLPDWFFAKDYVNFEVSGDNVIFVPAMGPAPCWSSKLADFDGNMEILWATFTKWCRENY